MDRGTEGRASGRAAVPAAPQQPPTPLLPARCPPARRLSCGGSLFVPPLPPLPGKGLSLRPAAPVTGPETPGAGRAAVQGASGGAVRKWVWGLSPAPCPPYPPWPSCASKGVGVAVGALCLPRSHSRRRWGGTQTPVLLSAVPGLFAERCWVRQVARGKGRRKTRAARACQGWGGVGRCGHIPVHHAGDWAPPPSHSTPWEPSSVQQGMRKTTSHPPSPAGRWEEGGVLPEVTGTSALAGQGVRDPFTLHSGH